MTLADRGGWQITVEQRPMLACCALWIRAVERIPTASDPLVPGPLDLATPSPESDVDDRTGLAAQWVQWWHSIVGPAGHIATTGEAEPAHDTIDPLGLAGRAALAAVVARRQAEAVRWHAAGMPEVNAPLDGRELVASAEAKLGRDAAAFDLHLTLLPVRDDEIRTVVYGRRYLVPERVYGSAAFQPWLRQLLEHII